MPHVTLLRETCCWPELGYKSSKWMYKKYTHVYQRSRKGGWWKKRHLLLGSAVCLQKHTLACKGNGSGGVRLLWWGIRKGAESFAAALATEGIISFFIH